MKFPFFLSSIILFLVHTTVCSQQFTGTWEGQLNIQNQKIPIVFHIIKNDTVYSATMDSPNQGVLNIPIEKVVVSKDSLILDIKAINGGYEGSTIDSQRIQGIFKQSGLQFNLELDKNKLYRKKIKPQEALVDTTAYESENIIFYSADNTQLSGTLSLPKTKNIIGGVILVSGSGPQNRNSEINGHKPFLVLSDYLSKNGIAVLRYDDRGTADSKGKFEKSTTYDFAEDAKAAVHYLSKRKEIEKNKITVIGHSEGGMIALMLANDIKFLNSIILLAAPGLKGDEILISQQKTLLRASKTFNEERINELMGYEENAYNLVQKYPNNQLLKDSLKVYFQTIYERDAALNKLKNTEKETQIVSKIKQLTDPWIYHFIRFNPKDFLKKVKCPVLALNGDKDYQVVTEENLNLIERTLTENGNKNVEIRRFENLNHLFQTAKTGLPSEYATNEETFSPLVMKLIKDWLTIQLLK